MESENILSQENIARQINKVVDDNQATAVVPHTFEKTANIRLPDNTMHPHVQFVPIIQPMFAPSSFTPSSFTPSLDGTMKQFTTSQDFWATKFPFYSKPRIYSCDNHLEREYIQDTPTLPTTSHSYPDAPKLPTSNSDEKYTPKLTANVASNEIYTPRLNTNASSCEIYTPKLQTAPRPVEVYMPKLSATPRALEIGAPKLSATSADVYDAKYDANSNVVITDFSKKSANLEYNKSSKTKSRVKIVGEKIESRVKIVGDIPKAIHNHKMDVYDNHNNNLLVVNPSENIVVVTPSDYYDEKKDTKKHDSEMTASKSIVDSRLKEFATKRIRNKFANHTQDDVLPDHVTNVIDTKSENDVEPSGRCRRGRTRNKNRQYSCKFCDKGYMTLGALKMHIRTHTLPCKCHICGKAFSRQWLLQGHIRTHTGERPYVCSYCGRAFADRSNLRAHIQTHLTGCGLECHACAKIFANSALLLRHHEIGCEAMLQTKSKE